MIGERALPAPSGCAGCDTVPGGLAGHDGGPRLVVHDTCPLAEHDRRAAADRADAEHRDMRDHRGRRLRRAASGRPDRARAKATPCGDHPFSGGLCTKGPRPAIRRNRQTSPSDVIEARKYRVSRVGAVCVATLVAPKQETGARVGIPSPVIGFRRPRRIARHRVRAGRAVERPVEVRRLAAPRTGRTARRGSGTPGGRVPVCPGARDVHAH